MNLEVAVTVAGIIVTFYAEWRLLSLWFPSIKSDNPSALKKTIKNEQSDSHRNNEQNPRILKNDSYGEGYPNHQGQIYISHSICGFITTLWHGRHILSRRNKGVNQNGTKPFFTRA